MQDYGVIRAPTLRGWLVLLCCRGREWSRYGYRHRFRQRNHLINILINAQMKMKTKIKLYKKKKTGKEIFRYEYIYVDKTCGLDVDEHMGVIF